LPAPEALGAHAPEVRGPIWLGVRAALEVLEVVLVQDHAVVLEAESPGDLRVGRGLVLIDLAVLQDLGDLLVEDVRLLHVALVELEVHLEGLVGDALQTAQVELSRLVRRMRYRHLLRSSSSGASARSAPRCGRRCAELRPRNSVGFSPVPMAFSR